MFLGGKKQTDQKRYAITALATVDSYTKNKNKNKCRFFTDEGLSAFILLVKKVFIQDFHVCLLYEKKAKTYFAF